MRIRPPAFATAPAPGDAAAADSPPPADRTRPCAETLAAYVALEPFDPDHGPAPASRRADGWSCDRQRTFLAALAEGTTVEAAAALVGLSPQSAYAFRQRAHGAAFSLGWHAALLLQRQRLADLLTSRAFDGQVDTYTRADGTSVTRHRHDNRLGLALLTRLDRLAALDEGADRAGEAQAARIVAGEWQRYLDLIAADTGPARAGLFLAARMPAGQGVGQPVSKAPAQPAKDAPDPLAALAPVLSLARADLYLRTGVGDAGEIDIADLDPAARHHWTADQWRRAEGAGLLALAPDPQQSQRSHAGDDAAQDDGWDGEGDDENDDGDDLDEDRDGDDCVWFDECRGEWRTLFPAPPGVPCDEEGQHLDGSYHRSLTAAEHRLVDIPRQVALARQAAAAHAARRAWFAARAQALDPDMPLAAEWLANGAVGVASAPDAVPDDDEEGACEHAEAPGAAQDRCEDALPEGDDPEGEAGTDEPRDGEDLPCLRNAVAIRRP